MKILFYVNDLRIGGCQINAVNLGKAIVHRGHAVIFTAEPGPLVERILKNGMAFEPLLMGQVQRPSLKIARKIAELALFHSVDIIQVFDTMPLMEAYASQVWHTKPVYGLITAQATPDFMLPQHQEIALVNPDTIERYKQRWEWPPEKLPLLTARLDCDLYQPQSVQVDRLFSGIPLKENAPILSLVSRIDIGKWETIELFLSAALHWQKTRAQELPVNFMIVGTGNLFPKLQTHIWDLGLSERVFAIGERLDIPEVMNASAVVMGMASTCQQGLACGRPVIVVGEKGFSELIEPNNFDYLAEFHFNLHFLSGENQPETLCQQFAKVLESSQYSSELKEFSRKIACERFDSRIGAGQLEKAYEWLINNQHVAWTSSLKGYKTFFLSWLSLQWVVFLRRVKRRWQMFLELKVFKTPTR